MGSNDGEAWDVLDIQGDKSFNNYPHGPVVANWSQTEIREYYVDKKYRNKSYRHFKMVILTLKNTDINSTDELYFGNLRYYTSEYNSSNEMVHNDITRLVDKSPINSEIKANDTSVLYKFSRNVSSYSIDNPHISQDIYDNSRDGLVIHKELQTSDGKRLMAGPHNYYNLKLVHPIFNMSIDSDNNLYLSTDIGTSHTGSVLTSVKFCKISSDRKTIKSIDLPTQLINLNDYLRIIVDSRKNIFYTSGEFRTPSDLGYKNANTNILGIHSGIRRPIRTNNSHLGGYIYKFYIQDDDTIKKPSNYGDNNNTNNKDAIIASFDKKYGAIRSCCLNKKDEVFYGTSNGYVLKINDKSLGRLDQDKSENTNWTF